MSRSNVSYIIRNSEKIIHGTAGWFCKRYPGYRYEEIRNVVKEGLFRAIRAYRPDCGALQVYAFYYCRSYVRFYIDRIYGRSKREVEFEDNFEFKDVVPYEDRLTLEKILERLSPEDRQILEAYAFGMTIKDAADELGISRWKYNIRFEAAIQRARELL